MFVLSAKLFDKLMKILRENAQINTVAEKGYLDGLTQGYIDIDAFHLAYDDIIKEVGARLEDLFYKRGDKVLKGRGSYGNIKLMKGFNDQVYKAMISLWLAQFKDNLPLKKDVIPATQTSTTTKLDKCATLIKAVTILNDVRHAGFIVTDVKEDEYGGVECTCQFPSGYKEGLGFINHWFDDFWNDVEDCPYISKAAINRIPKDANTETKAIMKIMSWFWENRDMGR